MSLKSAGAKKSWLTVKLGDALPTVTLCNVNFVFVFGW